VQTLAAVNNTVYGNTGLQVIRGAITIVGNGSTIRPVSTAPKFRIFAMSDAGNLTLQRTTISGGDASDTASYESPEGGGLYNHRAQSPLATAPSPAIPPVWPVAVCTTTLAA
jgi:hypothetical protein